MNWGKAGKVIVALVVYLVLTYGPLDALYHGWELVASPIPNAVGISLWLLLTAIFLWAVCCIVRKRA